MTFPAASKTFCSRHISSFTPVLNAFVFNSEGFFSLSFLSFPCVEKFTGRIRTLVAGWSFSVLEELDGEVADHSDAKDDQDDNQLGENAELGLEDVGHDEAEALPEPVVGERGLLVLLEKDTVQS